MQNYPVGKELSSTLSTKHYFVCVDSLHPSQQVFSHVGTCLPVLNNYQAEDKVSCSRTQQAQTTTPLS